MLSFRRVSSTLVTTAVMAIFMTSSLVHAQSGTPAVACDATFGKSAANRSGIRPGRRCHDLESTDTA